MKDLFTPDLMLPTYREVTPELLRERGIRALLIDIDNTLAPYEQPDPDEEIRAWFASLAAAGIRAAFVSNNHPPRVERFAAPLGIPFFAKAGKPGKKTLLLAMETLGVTKEETAVLGDQLLTDSHAGKRLGLVSLIVPPIKDKTNLFFRFKRRMERRYIRRYARKNGYQTYMAFWKIGKDETI